jgi:sulfur carrier protein
MNAHDPQPFVVANGQRITLALPATLEEFLVSQKLLPRSVVVEHNGDAVAPSEFAQRAIRSGDRLEIVRIVAGG